MDMQQVSTKVSDKVINDPYELLKEVSKIDDVRIVENQRTIFSDVVLYDISLNEAGPQEDDVLAKNKFLRNNLRRGNTVMQLFHSDGTVFKTIWARRGMFKFFDLYREYLEFNLSMRKELKNFGIKSNDIHEQLHSILFTEVKRAIRAGESVHVYSTEKLNGENAQVTWSADTNSWLIASKNVSILVTKRSDINEYRSDRFYFASQIAHSWFDLLDELDESKVDLENLKKDLTGRTLVGEYVGNSRHQHLIKYPRTMLIWFSLVQMDTQTYGSLESTQEFLDHYQLDSVRVHDLGVFNDFTQLNKFLLHRFDYVASADTESQGEGSVLYLQREHQNEKEIISVSKLKTLEYRILRKLREKLRNYIEDHKVSKKETLKLFKKEVYDLCGVNKPARTHEFYYKIAEIAFEYADSYENKARRIHEQYVDFIGIMYDCFESGKDATPQMFSEQNLAALSKVKLSERAPETFNPRLSPVPQPQPKHGSQQAPSKEVLPVVQQPTTAFLQSPPLLSKKTVIAIIPIGIPGMGKTYFGQKLSQVLQSSVANYEYSEVSSDRIKKQVIERDKDKKSTQDFINKKANQIYEDSVKTAVLTFSRGEKSTLFLYLDKNHPPNGINKAVTMIRSEAQPNVNIVTVGVKPLCMNIFDRQNRQLPFSLNFILTCIERVLERENHETLNGTFSEKCSVLFMFISMFLKDSLDHSTLPGLDHLLGFPFIIETANDDDKFSLQLEDDFIDVLDDSSPDRKCTKKNLLLSFLDELKEADLDLENYDEATYLKNIIHHVVGPLVLKLQLTPFKVEQPQPIQPQRQQKIKEKQVEQISQIQHPQPPVKVSEEDDYEGDQQNSEEKKEDNENKKRKRVRKNQGGKMEGRKKFEPYNPTYLPLYLGIFVTQSKFSADRAINKWIKDCFIKTQSLIEDKHSDDPDFYRMKNQWQSSANGAASFYELSKPLHVTTLFVGNQGETVRQLSYFKDFQPEQEHNLHLTVLMASPDNLITALVQPPSIPVQNPYPHITLYTGKLKAKESNDLIASALSQDYECKTAALKRQQGTDQVYRIKFNYRSKPTVVFVVCIGDHLRLDGTARAYDK